MGLRKKTKGNILEINKADQYRTVDELVEKSQENSVYYTLLILSSFIVASGLLLNNSAIVIGGMLVAPLLTPILLIALGLALGQIRPIRNAILLVVKSVIIVVAAALVMSLVFGSSNNAFVFDDSAQTAVLYFVVAIASGVAATFAWTRREVADVLPGVAIVVSLVPPLAIVGVALSSWAIPVARFHFLIFLFNLLGILVGSLVVFSLLKFYRTGKEIERKTKAVAKK